MTHEIAVIGGGAAGLGAARAASWAGARAALISDAPLGGDCTWTGCVPSKTLLSAAAKGASFSEAMATVHQVIGHIAATEDADALREDGIDVVEGRAVFEGPGRLLVNGDRLIESSRIVIGAGTRPGIPPIPGLDGVPYLTNETIWDAPPFRSLAILGGGPIGCELSQAFAQLGVAVTLVEITGRILGKEEPQASEIVARSLRSRGVDLRLNAHIERITHDGTSFTLHSAVTDRAGNPSSDVVVDSLLVAAGRAPLTEGLGLEAAGIATDAWGFIATDAKLRTSVAGHFAAGDVTGRAPFTHAADEMGRLAAGNALRKGYRGKFRDEFVPWATFTDPEVGRIGLTEHDAAAVGGRVAYLPLEEMDRAVTDGATDGYIKLIAGPKAVTRRLFAGRLIGATIVAPRAGDMIAGVGLAMRAGMFTGRLAQTLHAYPTWSWGIQKTAGQFFQRIEGREARPARRDED